jgi:hypothetical protein
MFFRKKENDDVHRPIVTSPTAADHDNPARDFLVLISVIITTPIIFLISLLTGRIKSPFVVVAFLLLIMTGFYYLSKSHVVSKNHIKSKIIQQTLEELTPEEKEELHNEISTLRKSIDTQKLPESLNPLLDVPLDMLNINYLLFMIQSGYIKPDGEGSEFILDSYLHSQHKLLREKSWEALQNIQSPQAETVMKNFEAEMIRRKAEMQKKYGTTAPRDTGIIEDFQDDVKDRFQKLRNAP